MSTPSDGSPALLSCRTDLPRRFRARGCMAPFVLGRALSLVSLSGGVACSGADASDRSETDAALGTHDETSATTDGGQDSAPVQTVGDGGTDEETDGRGDGESAGTDGPALGCPTEPPTGILLTDASVFQVIEVPIVQQCQRVEADDRVAALVAGRVAVARATVALDANFTNAEIAVRVDLASSAGPETFLGTCTPTRASRGTADLHVGLPGAALRVDTTYRMSIVECDVPDVDLAAFPSEGTAALGAQETGIIRLHLVPFEVSGFVPDTSDAVIEGLRDAILAVYPVSAVEITIEPVQPDDEGGQNGMMGRLGSRVLALQEAQVFASGDVDPAVSDIYFYGMVTGAATRDAFCASCPTGTSESGCGDRAGSGIGAAFADELAESTLVHELGHMHGLTHSPCGDPNLQDPEFPYADGATHTEGWDFRTGTFIASDTNDLMGYCQPRWVSDYHYRKMVDWVHRAATWQQGDAQPDPRLCGG